jgi:hypothetical protein
MKQIKKLSLSNVIGKLTRNEMRYVMAGSGSTCKTSDCTVYDSNTGMTHTGTCESTWGNNIVTCYCLSSLGDYNVGNSSGMSHCFA